MVPLAVMWAVAAVMAGRMAAVPLAVAAVTCPVGYSVGADSLQADNRLAAAPTAALASLLADSCVVWGVPRRSPEQEGAA